MKTKISKSLNLGQGKARQCQSRLLCHARPHQNQNPTYTYTTVGSRYVLYKISTNFAIINATTLHSSLFKNYKPHVSSDTNKNISKKRGSYHHAVLGLSDINTCTLNPVNHHYYLFIPGPAQQLKMLLKNSVSSVSSPFCNCTTHSA